MTLSEALATGKLIRRASVGGDYLTYEEYQDEFGVEREDILATDFEVSATNAVEISEADIVAAWNAARAGTSIKAAGSSDFYKKFVSNLLG